jgi:hypothetical protein
VTNQILIRAKWLHDFYSMSSNLIVLHDYTAKLKNADTARAALVFKFN